MQDIQEDGIVLLDLMFISAFILQGATSCHHLQYGSWGSFHYSGSKGTVMMVQTLQTVLAVWNVHFEVFWP